MRIRPSSLHWGASSAKGVMEQVGVGMAEDLGREI